jgi:serine/threonine protein kinase
MQNILQFNARMLQPAQFVLKTKARSLSFGRRLYQFQAAVDGLGGAPQLFWLKGQLCSASSGNLVHHSAQAAAGFQHELSLYQALQRQRAGFLLPFQIIQTDCLSFAEGLYPQALVLPDAPPLFSLDPRQLSMVQIQALLLQAADALDQLAQLGWLHADIKQEHFVQHAGQVRLIDLEQAQPIHALPPPELNATPRYMAPELFQGQPKSLQSDVYAFGIVLYEWLTGQRLQALHYEDWAYLHCQRLNIDLPQQFRCFQPVLQAMLAKRKSQRMRDFSQVKTRLTTEIA